MQQYPLLMRTLHSLIATLVIAMIIMGWTLSEMDHEAAIKPTLKELHRTIGLLLFPLGLAQLSAYLVLLKPAFVPMPHWQATAARLVHWFLLAAVITIPVLGYFMSGDKLLVLGGWTVPALIDLPKELRKTLFEAHEFLAYTTAAVVGLHVAGALKHHFIDRDNTLKKMF